MADTGPSLSVARGNTTHWATAPAPVLPWKTRKPRFSSLRDGAILNPPPGVSSPRSRRTGGTSSNRSGSGQRSACQRNPRDGRHGVERGRIMRAYMWVILMIFGLMGAYLGLAPAVTSSDPQKTAAITAPL